MKNRTYIISVMVGMLLPTVSYAQQNTASTDETMSERLGVIAKKTDKLNIFFNMQGDFSVQDVDANHSIDRNGIDTMVGKGRYRTAYGYIGGIEYYPMKDSSLHFFAVYVGRNYHYTSRAKAFGANDYNTNRVSVGFVWRMPVF